MVDARPRFIVLHSTFTKGTASHRHGQLRISKQEIKSRCSVASIENPQQSPFTWHHPSIMQPCRAMDQSWFPKRWLEQSVSRPRGVNRLKLLAVTAVEAFTKFPPHSAEHVLVPGDSYAQSPMATGKRLHPGNRSARNAMAAGETVHPTEQTHQHSCRVFELVVVPFLVLGNGTSSTWSLQPWRLSYRVRVFHGCSIPSLCKTF
jgi:hypothetical protein